MTMSINNTSTYSSMNITIKGESLGDSAQGLIFLDYSQLMLTIIGVIANAGTFITLMKNGQTFSPVVRLLLTHQSLVDGAACLFATMLFLQPENWMPGILILDTFFCHVWNGQCFYWYFVMVSIWNLVTIAAERYLAVCCPFKHVDFTTRRVKFIFFAIYILSVPCLSLLVFQTYIEDGICVSGFYFEGPVAEKVYLGFAVSTFLTMYAVPVTCFFILYGMVVISMQRRKNNSDFESNKVIDTAASQLTKTAITVTAIFIVALGYDLWYYLLAYAGVAEYITNSLLQKIGVWFAAFNSVANPFVYALLMPVYRNSVMRTFCPCAEKGR